MKVISKGLSLIVALLILGGVILFTFQNWPPATLYFLSFEKEMPLAIIAVGFYIIGSFTGGLLYSVFRKTIKDRKDTNN